MRLNITADMTKTKCETDRTYLVPHQTVRYISKSKLCRLALNSLLPYNLVVRDLPYCAHDRTITV